MENFNEGLVSLYGSYIDMDTMKYTRVWFRNIQCVLCIEIVYYYIIDINSQIYNLWSPADLLLSIFSTSFFEISVVLESRIDVFAIL